MILALASDANAYTSLGPDEERIETERYVLWLGPYPGPSAAVAQRLRIPPAEVEQTVAEVRALVRAGGRAAFTWEVAGTAEPPDLVDRLLELGCVPDRDSHVVGMALTAPPAGGESPGVVTRRVQSVEEMRAAIRIAATAFEMPDEELPERLARAGLELAREGPATATYLAFLEGEPVARATAAFTPHGVLLFGGATLPSARGRGCYRALVQARWDDAVARGTPALVTHAGAMSRPILRALGFRELTTIRVLVDASAPSGSMRP